GRREVGSHPFPVRKTTPPGAYPAASLRGRTHAPRRRTMSQLSHTKNARRTAASPDLLVFPGQAGWDEARRAWNLAVQQQPGAGALPQTGDGAGAAGAHAPA